MIETLRIREALHSLLEGGVRLIELMGTAELPRPPGTACTGCDQRFVAVAVCLVESAVAVKALLTLDAKASAGPALAALDRGGERAFRFFFESVRGSKPTDACPSCDDSMTAYAMAAIPMVQASEALTGSYDESLRAEETA